MSVKEVK